MSDATHAALTSSKSSNWRTPQWLFDALDREFHLVLDAAADESNAKCPLYLGPGGVLEDALCGVPWFDIVEQVHGTHGPIFLNPPYTQQKPIGPWVEQAAVQSERGSIIAIFPFSPQTRWWRKYVVGDMYRATEIRRFPFRLKFEPPPDYVGDAPGANVNSVVAIYHPTDAFTSGLWVPHDRYWIPDNFPGKRELYSLKDEDDE